MLDFHAVEKSQNVLLPGKRECFVLLGTWHFGLVRSPSFGTSAWSPRMFDVPKTFVRLDLPWSKGREKRKAFRLSLGDALSRFGVCFLCGLVSLGFHQVLSPVA